MKIELTTLAAHYDTRGVDVTDGGMTLREHVILTFGDAEVVAWPVPAGDEENELSTFNQDSPKYLAEFVAAKLGALLR